MSDFADDFNRANISSLAAPWLKFGTGANTGVISNLAESGPPPIGNSMYYLSDQIFTDIEVTWNGYLREYSTAAPAIMVRHQLPDAGYCWAGGIGFIPALQSANGAMYVYRYNSDRTYQELGRKTTGLGDTRNRAWKFRLVGNSFQMYCDGILQISGSDALMWPSGRVALANNSSVGCKYDNFVLTDLTTGQVYVPKASFFL